ncbi:MAG: hypothetical protein AAFR59_17245, partial [Bacteroidota bacterium]
GIGEWILGTENPSIGSHSVKGYILSLGVYILPTVLIMGSFVFLSVGVTRNIFSGFGIVIGFVLLQTILENTLFNQKELLAVFDPFGEHAFYLTTQDWGFERQNSEGLPVGIWVLANRGSWLALTVGAWRLFFRKFDFQYDFLWQRKFKIFDRNQQTVGQASERVIHKEDSEIALDFSFPAQVRTGISLMIYDFTHIARGWIFLCITGLGALGVFFIQLTISQTGDFNLLPLTRLFLGAPLIMFSLLVMLTTFIFSGQLIHRARQRKMNLMLDVTPSENWQWLTAKIGAISLVQMLQLLIFLCTSLLIQAINGYHTWELDLYIFHLFVLVMPILFVWNVTSYFIHSLFPHLLLSLFVLTCLWFVGLSLDDLDNLTRLLTYNSVPFLSYSDFQGYGF